MSENVRGKEDIQVERVRSFRLRVGFTEATV